MSRVHTILSILAEDHAPAALRPSILLAVDWPTVAEEAPATGDDSGIACAASGLISGIGGRENYSPEAISSFAAVAARLATVAASLTATGDKAMAHHAAALWGAAGALAGMPTRGPADDWSELIAGIVGLTGVRCRPDQIGVMLEAVARWHKNYHDGASDRAAITALASKASDIVPGVIAVGLGEQETLIATALDRVHELNTRAQAGEHRLRDLGWDGKCDPVAWASRHKAALEMAQSNERATMNRFREVRSERDDLRTTIDTVWPLVGTLENFVAGVRLLKQRADECDTITAQRNGASDVAARRLAIIMQHDEQDLRLRDILGAEANETTENAAKRVATTRNVLQASGNYASDKMREAQAELASVREALSAWNGETTIDAAWRITDGLNTKSKALYDARAERYALRAQVDRMIAAMREDAPPVKPRPQPGDVVPWADVEDGCLYFDTERNGARFFAHHSGRWFWLHNAEDDDICALLQSGRGWTGELKHTHTKSAILVARDLGTDPEVWRRAMREWTAKDVK